MEEKPRVQHGQKFCMEERKHAELTGINDVISFDPEKVILESDCGHITMKGSDLKVKRLSVEKQEIEIVGRIDSVVYTEVNSMSKSKDSVLGRLFR